MLNALPYHKKVVAHFKQQHKTWQYFAQAKNKAGQLQQFKTDLLKNTYKFSPENDATIYDKLAFAKEQLELSSLSVTVYQAQYTDELNASIVYMENEAHIVFSGSIIKLLNEDELLAVLAHELSHVKLYTMLDFDIEIADRIITSIANNYSSEPSYYETARLFRLYTEIFCDRGAFKVLNNIDPVISSLVKISTGLEQVNADNYIKQADEIFINDKGFTTAGISHPENFIRAKSLQLWRDDKANADELIGKMIISNATLDHLDIFQQQEISTLTRTILQLLLKPKWMQTSLAISHARQFFTDFKTEESTLLTNDVIDVIEQADKSIKEYLCYVLLDFCLVDTDLEIVPSGWAFQFAEDLKLKEIFDRIVKKEMTFSDKKLKQYKEKALNAFYAMKENEREQIYE